MNLSILIPCFNEEKTIKTCILDAKTACQEIKIRFEIIVIDNNSTDNSADIAKKSGAKVIVETKQGYGAAYLKGIKEAKGTYIFMADADNTYNFLDIKKFYALAMKGHDFVIGNRFTKYLKKNVMPPLHRYIGNPFLSGLINILYGSPVRDAHCGARLIKRNTCEKLNLKSKGMEFASEMIIKIAKKKIPIKQINISYHKRISPSKLKSFQDGWQHLRFIFMMSQTTLYIIPGIIVSLSSIILLFFTFFGQIQIQGVQLDVHSMLVLSILLITGTQLLFTGYFSRVFSITYLKEKDFFIEKIQKYLTLEKALLIGGGIFFTSIIWGLSILSSWITQGFPEINKIKIGILLFTFMIISLQIITSSFYFYTIKTINEEKW